VAARFASLGAHIIDADLLAREVVAPGMPALDEIVARWGKSMLTDDCHLDRGALRRIVFDDKVQREALNAIVHPRVEALRIQRVAEAQKGEAPIIIYDIPLLFEGGKDDAFDAIVLVDAPRSTRRARLTELRRLSPEQADQMLDAQMNAEHKRAKADYIIENDGTMEALFARVDEVWRALLARD
jgi:dephospho-CoA kinase